MEIRKIILVMSMGLIILYAGTSNAQEKKTRRDWVSFTQRIKVKTDTETKFKLTAAVKTESKEGEGIAGLWARVDNTNGEAGFFDNMMDRPVKSGQWKYYSIEGVINENSEKINFGGICLYNGKFYFDDFKLFIQNKKGQYEEMTIENFGFENTIDKKNKIPGWKFGVGRAKEVFVEGFDAMFSTDVSNGKYALLIEGKGIKRRSAVIRTEEGFTPQIGVMVSMLNNLSDRVDRVVRDLDIRETDHLLDEKANRIGALIMHLAAAEAYYQVYTFENREFNDDEKEKWLVGLDLGTKAREQFKGKPINYYLDIYKEVRKKTIEELKKRDDEWFDRSRPGSSMNNHFAWFHVMEHQSSHLGQILMLKKRIPEEEKNEIKTPDVAID